MSTSIPSDHIKLRLIFVNCGDKSKEFIVPLSSTALDVAHQVFANWPEEWNSQKVENAEILKLIYQGKFLHEKVILSSLNLKGGKTTVMHLIPREKLPEANPSDVKKERNHNRSSESSFCCCNIL